MSKFKRGELRSGSKRGSVVKNRKQAIAIMLSEKRKASSNSEYESKSTDPSESVMRKKMKK